MSIHWPFDGRPFPQNLNMQRQEYDPNNDGAIDGINNGANVIITSSGLFLKNTTTGLWNQLTISGVDGAQTITIADGVTTPS